MKVKELNIKHPEYDAELVLKYDLLYEGGDVFLKQVPLFLPKRNSEAQKLYTERLARAFYISYTGPIIDYFVSNLFTFNSNINHKGDGGQSKFYDEFFDNCDLKGTGFDDFFEQVFTNSLIHQKSYILVDFPSISSDIPPPINALEEEAMGLTRAYLVHFEKKDLIDWQYDDLGNFDWVKFYCLERYKPSFNAPELKRHRWYIYDKNNYTIFQYDEDPDRALDPEIQDAKLIGQGKHSSPGTVPIHCLEVPKGLWIMNKLASVQIELFNLDNAMAWQEYQAHYAMPVIKLKDGKSFKQRMGEAYFIQLDVEESFEWSEPEGKMMEVGLRRREMLKDEIFRVVHQLSLSIEQTKSQTRKSGNSKQEDRYSTEVVLRAFGDIIRETMQSVLGYITEARHEIYEWDVSGFSTFDTDSMTEKLAQVLQLRAINIHSETFNKEMEKRAIDGYLEDLNHETKEIIKSEIEKFDFSTIIEDPLAGSFATRGQVSEVIGSSSSSQQGQKPNGTNKPTPNKPTNNKSKEIKK